MEKKTTRNQMKIFQFKVSLPGTEPLVWRRFLVPGNITFGCLHDVIQAVMGWWDDHSHSFAFKSRKEQILPPGMAKEMANYPYDRREKFFSEDDVTLDERFRRAGQKVFYTYDFGDYWEHELVLEERRPYDGKQLLPMCMDGDRAHPLEDCGGVWRHQQILAMLEAPEEVNEEDLEWLRDWAPNYDPTAFDIEKINRKLRPRKFDGSFDMKIAQAFLNCMSEPVSLKNFLETLRFNDTAAIRGQAVDFILDSGDHVYDRETEKIYSNDYLLDYFKVRIQPTPMEIEQGILFIGHRIFPFRPGFINLNRMHLYDASRELETKTVQCPPGEAESFFSLLNRDFHPLHENGAPEKSGASMEFAVWDVKEFYKRTRFKPGDSIMLKADELYRNFFSIKCVSTKKMEKLRKTIPQKDQLMLKSLREALRLDIPYVSVAHQLLYAVFLMGRKNWTVPGSELTALFAADETLEPVPLPDGRTLLRLKKNAPGHTPG